MPFRTPVEDRRVPTFLHRLLMGARCGALVLVLAARALAAEPSLEFTGVLVFPGKTMIVLREPAEGTSKFLTPGGTFAGYTLISYEAKDEIVVVAREGEAFRLRLREAKVQTAESTNLQQQSLPERSRVWNLVKDLEGQPLAEALILYGDQELRAALRQMRTSLDFLNATKARMTESLRTSALTGEKRAAQEDAAAKLDERMRDAQGHVDQQALKAKEALRQSLAL